MFREIIIYGAIGGAIGVTIAVLLSFLWTALLPEPLSLIVSIIGASLGWFGVMAGEIVLIIRTSK